MAIIGTNQDDENPQTGAAPGNTLGGGSGFVGGGSGQGATTSAKPTSSGSYTNLSSYLGANQGAGAQMGQAAEHVVDQAGQKADQAIGQYSKAGAPASGMANSAYQDLVGQLGNAGGTQAGTSALLGSAYAQPNYSAGERGLDAFLVNQGGGAGALQKAQSDWGGEGSKLDAATALANSKAAGGGNTVTPTATTAIAAPSDNVGSSGATSSGQTPAEVFTGTNVPGYTQMAGGTPAGAYTQQSTASTPAKTLAGKSGGAVFVNRKDTGTATYQAPPPPPAPPPPSVATLNNTPMGTTGQGAGIPNPEQPFAGVLQQLQTAGQNVVNSTTPPPAVAKKINNVLGTRWR